MAKRKRPDAPYWVTLKKAERDMIAWALEQTGCNMEDAASMLGIDLSFLYRRCRELDLQIIRPATKRPGRPRKEPVTEPPHDQ